MDRPGRWGSESKTKEGKQASKQKKKAHTRALASSFFFRIFKFLLCSYFISWPLAPSDTQQQQRRRQRWLLQVEFPPWHSIPRQQRPIHSHLMDCALKPVRQVDCLWMVMPIGRLRVDSVSRGEGWNCRIID
jgi:hypothetical protein